MKSLPDIPIRLVGQRWRHTDGGGGGGGGGAAADEMIQLAISV